MRKFVNGFVINYESLYATNSEIENFPFESNPDRMIFNYALIHYSYVIRGYIVLFSDSFSQFSYLPTPLYR